MLPMSAVTLMLISLICARSWSPVRSEPIVDWPVSSLIDIYDYPPRQELEVAEHIRQLVSQLQTMTPKYDGDYAPQVLTLDLFDVVLEILGNRGILDRVLNREAKRHRKVSSDAHTDKFLGLLDNVLGADTAQLPDTIRDHYKQAKSEGGANIVFITGIGKVLPVYSCAYTA